MIFGGESRDACRFSAVGGATTTRCCVVTVATGLLTSGFSPAPARGSSSDAVPDTFRGPGATRAPGPGETIAMVGLVVSGPELDPFGVAEIGGLRGPVPTAFTAATA